MKFWALLLFLLLSPAVAGATGFAKQSLFLSKTPVTEGETVFIHAVVANDGTATFKGDVVFKDGQTKIGSVAVSIAPGGANAVSVSWKPTAGSHAVAAELTNAAGTAVETQSAMFIINERPKPASAGSSTIATSSPVESSTDIQNKIKDYSPATANIVAPVFSTLDAARIKAATLLDTGIAWAQEKSAGKKVGLVLGEDSTKSADGGAVDTATSLFAVIVGYVLSFLRFIVGSAAVFYPVFALLFFYILWRLFKRMRRPRYGAV